MDATQVQSVVEADESAEGDLTTAVAGIGIRISTSMLFAPHIPAHRRSLQGQQD